MSTASEKAAAFLSGARTGADAPAGKTFPATGERAELAALLDADDLDDAQQERFDELAAKYRRRELGGRPRRTVRRRESVAGEMYEGKAPKPLTASELAAREIRGI